MKMRAPAAAALLLPWLQPSRVAIDSARRTRGIRADEDPAARRERLRQLFGEEASERLAPRLEREKREAALEALEADGEEDTEIQMLQDGMRSVSWGATRLVDVAMAKGPLEVTLQPVLPRGTSKLLCVRLDMPLGMLIEEAPVPNEAALVRPTVVELFPQGSAEPSGVRIGDIVRATTAVNMAMDYPVRSCV